MEPSEIAQSIAGHGGIPQHWQTIIESGIVVLAGVVSVLGYLRKKAKAGAPDKADEDEQLDGVAVVRLLTEAVGHLGKHEALLEEITDFLQRQEKADEAKLRADDRREAEQLADNRRREILLMQYTQAMHEVAQALHSVAKKVVAQNASAK